LLCSYSYMFILSWLVVLLSEYPDDRSKYFKEMITRAILNHLNGDL
jgi:hypothetical protein